MKKIALVFVIICLLGVSSVGLAADNTPTYYLTGNHILNGGPNVGYRYLGKKAETFTQTIMFSAKEGDVIYNLRTSPDGNNCQKFLPNHSMVTLTCVSTKGHILVPTNIPKGGNFQVTPISDSNGVIIGFTITGEVIKKTFCGAGSANSNYITTLLADQSGGPARCTITMTPSTNN